MPKEGLNHTPGVRVQDASDVRTQRKRGSKQKHCRGEVTMAEGYSGDDGSYGVVLGQATRDWVHAVGDWLERRCATGERRN